MISQVIKSSPYDHSQSCCPIPCINCSRVAGSYAPITLTGGLFHNSIPVIVRNLFIQITLVFGYFVLICYCARFVIQLKWLLSLPGLYFPGIFIESNHTPLSLCFARQNKHFFLDLVNSPSLHVYKCEFSFLERC